MTPSDLRFLARLAPPDPTWGGTGAVKLVPSPTDYPMRLLPGVGELLDAGAFVPVDFSSDVQQIYDQGAEPSCVAFSDCGLASTEDFRGDHNWDVLDGHGFYRQCGGTGREGIDSRVALERARTAGIPILSGSGSVRIGSYVFASQQPGQFRQEVAAAIALGHFVTIALLLPTDFGWNSSLNAQKTSGYHQVFSVGVTGLGDDDDVICANSWGKGFGNNGLVRLKWGYLERENLQNHYVFGYAVTPLVLPNPNPTPDPVPVPTPTPSPPPVDLRIDSVIGTATVPAAAPGETFRVTGSGFGAGVIAARIGVTPCPVIVQNDSLLIVTAPALAVVGALAVRREGVEKEGPFVVVRGNAGPTPAPDPTPTPDPTPQPTPQPTPGDLTISVTPPVRLNRRQVLLTAGVSFQGPGVQATVTVTQDGLSLGEVQTLPSGLARLIVAAAAGSRVLISAVDPAGHQGAVTITV